MTYLIKQPVIHIIVSLTLQTKQTHVSTNINVNANNINSYNLMPHITFKVSLENLVVDHGLIEYI